MKKFFSLKSLMLTLVMLFTITFASAQTAIQTSKITDNISVGISAGATTPLSFNDVFPVNATAGLTVAKQLTPVFGLNAEGIAWFGSNANKGSRFDNYVAHNGVRAINVGANSTINLTNLLNGYQGKPQVFEFGAEGGIGWLHTLVPNATNKNDMSVKTQANFILNVGKNRAHTLKLSPVIWWNVTSIPGSRLAFNKNYAQIALMISYVYNFKTSNGTRYFKVYDVGAMEDAIKNYQALIEEKEQQIADLRQIKASAPAEVREKIEYVEVPAETVIYFAFDDYSLDDNAKAALDKIPALTKVCVIGTASTEGTEEYNLKLSQKRADAVADFLRERGVVVEGSEGKGISLGETSNRVAIVTPAE